MMSFKTVRSMLLIAYDSGDLSDEDFLCVHSLKFQTLALPNGLIGHMYSPVGMLSLTMLLYIKKTQKIFQTANLKY